MIHNCDNNFGTFDDFGVKNDQKVSHNMILMSKYKGQHGGKKGKKNRVRPFSPPPFQAMPERNRFFPWEVFPQCVAQYVVMLPSKLLSIFGSNQQKMEVAQSAFCHFPIS